MKGMFAVGSFFAKGILRLSKDVDGLDRTFVFRHEGSLGCVMESFCTQSPSSNSMYTMNRWSNGGTLGISAYPVMFNNGSKLGFYFDAYRGSRIYTDFFNQKEFDIPASGFMKFGLSYKL
ncbi:MAG: hypothetical protein EA361_00665 [Bacteroidetes bacterium]|nr:MAG: hypothetical protein EA361_00665 [Bacteroidota bacterium]